VRLRFVAADRGGDSVVEAAVDDLTLYEASSMALDAPAVKPGATLALSAPRPNPSRDGIGFTVRLPSAGRLRIEVLDVAGRAMRTLHDGPAAAGALALRWDGRSADGVAAAPGLYLVRALLDGRQAVRRVVLVR